MEDNVQKPDKKAKLLWQYKIHEKGILMSLAQCNVMKKQATEAYEILWNMRFDMLSDTAFRDKITRAKKELESFFKDFLLDPSYHRERLNEHRKMSPEEYQEHLEEVAKEPTQNKGE